MADVIVEGSILTSGRALGTLVAIGARPNSETAKASTPVVTASESDIRRFRNEVAELAQEFQRIAAELENESKKDEAEIMRTHAELVSDNEFRGRVEHAIKTAELAAETAVLKVADDIGSMFKTSGNQILAERAADIEDIASQLHHRLRGIETALRNVLPGDVDDPVVLLDELFPSHVIAGRDCGVQAFIVEFGTTYSHAAILAQSFGIPILRMDSIEALKRHNGSVVLVDGEQEGRVLVSPDPEEQQLVNEKVQIPPVPAGRQMPVQFWLNIASPTELPHAEWGCAAGVGLYRTETLLMAGRSAPPSEDEQFTTYCKLLKTCGDKPVTVRCFDIGGDKPAAFMRFGHNENPQLGLRSLRLFHYHPDLFLGQIRALARATSDCGKPRLLFPMVETPEQWRFINELTDQAVSETDLSGRSPKDVFERGFMIETPSALWCLDELFERADFASVGSNDLVQYLLGVDRASPDVSDYYRPEHPTVLRALRHVVKVSESYGKPVILCGEMAHDPYLLPVLVGLGFQNLSVPLRTLPQLAERAAGLELDHCRELAGKCLSTAESSGVMELLSEWHGEDVERTVSQENLHRDPICGMSVEPAATPFWIVEKGRTVYFCSLTCLKAYREQQKEETDG